MQIPSYFKDFLGNIRPGQTLRDQYKEAHKELRAKLLADEKLGPMLHAMFLQGSYRRATAIKPHANKKADVDLVLVTYMCEEDYPDPKMAQAEFYDFLNEHYPGQWEAQGRSLSIVVGDVDLDMVITAAPSLQTQEVLKSARFADDSTLEDLDEWPESLNLVKFSTDLFSKVLQRSAEGNNDWMLEPLRIPDRDAQCWRDTHPLAQLAWTWNKNRLTGGHYINVVKALKWWRRVNHPTPKYPKGYPVEHLIGACCPDGIPSVADGVTLTLEAIVTRYAYDAALKQTPVMPDHGVPEHNVFLRVTGEDFAEFYEQVKAAALVARRALDATTIKASADAWRELFGSEFPEAPAEATDASKGGFVTPTRPANPRPEQYA